MCVNLGTHWDTRVKASEHTGGQGTRRTTMPSAAAWKWACASLSRTEARVAVSSDLPSASPPESRMCPPWTTRIRSWVRHFL